MRQEEKALKRQLQGKSKRHRFEGLRRSERNEAKLFLLAGVPVLAVALFTPNWADANAWEKLFMVAALAWATTVLLIGCFYIFRSLTRLSKRDENERRN